MTSPIRQAIESGDLSEVGRLYAKQLAEMGKPVNPYGANAQVDALPVKANPISDLKACQPAVRGTTTRQPTPEIDAGRSTPFTPTPSNSTSPSPAPGGVGSNSEEVK